MPSLLDFIFPKKCVSCGRIGSYLCNQCVKRIEYVQFGVCAVCQRQAVGGKTHPGCKSRYTLDGLVLGFYYRGQIRAAIQKIKYRFSYDILALILDLSIKNVWRFDLPSEKVLIPIPLYKKRKNWRGFNQAELMAVHIGKKFGEKFLLDVLVRTRETKTQVGLVKKERKENIRDAFKVQNPKFVQGLNVLLVDDVYTTGSTMAEAAKVLKKAGAASVWGMAIALG